MRMKSPRLVLVVVVGLAVLSVSGAVASHQPVVDPNLVPPGLLATHNEATVIAIRKEEA
jgi:ABC-type cobalamin transport system permease subunit